MNKLQKDNETNRMISSQQNSSLIKLKDQLSQLYNDINFVKNENVSKNILTIFICNLFFVI